MKIRNQPCPNHLRRVKELECVVCGLSPCDAHHIRERKGMGQKAHDMETIPLCKEHHQGDSGFHALGRETWENIYGKQRDHVNATQRKLYE